MPFFLVWRNRVSARPEAKRCAVSAAFRSDWRATDERYSPVRFRLRAQHTSHLPLRPPNALMSASEFGGGHCLIKLSHQPLAPSGPARSAAAHLFAPSQAQGRLTSLRAPQRAARAASVCGLIIAGFLSQRQAERHPNGARGIPKTQRFGLSHATSFIVGAAGLVYTNLSNGRFIGLWTGARSWQTANSSRICA